MNSNDWKSELSHMLEVIEKQSTASLGKINQQFKALGLPFDENFRQDVVKMTNFRLESSFMKVDVENRGQSTHGPIIPNANGSESANYRAGNPNLSEQKITIEIDDSDHEMELDNVKTEQQDTNAMPNDGNLNSNESRASNTNGRGNGIKIVNVTSILKNDPNVPSTSSSGNHGNGNHNRNGMSGVSSADDGAIASSSMKGDQSGQIRPAKRGRPMKHSYFNCVLCKYGSNLKCNLRTHEKIHLREDSMGLARDPSDGLLHCPRCPEKYKQLRGIISHMRKLHAKN